ncbi:hypothetical protein [Rhizobium tumorigenes]|uniref:hypothetical protein n=1 Tax=Rhizobium tumorigenes TaxID=2041385 RepID=UPI00241DF784|nr:hypothetical protein [Rhizobium tumorigenes]WFS01571.1 hypothetical protein PR016_02755 [Rhizobium tumorigenes]
MNVKQFAMVIIALSAPCAAAASSEAEKAAKSFGYAIQAMGWCKAYSVHAQREAHLDEEYGEPMRGDALKPSFGLGLQRFMTDEAKYGTNGACNKAWSRVGPTGSEYPGLLMKNPFMQ